MLGDRIATLVNLNLNATALIQDPKQLRGSVIDLSWRGVGMYTSIVSASTIDEQWIADEVLDRPF